MTQMFTSKRLRISRALFHLCQIARYCHVASILCNLDWVMIMIGGWYCYYHYHYCYYCYYHYFCRILYSNVCKRPTQFWFWVFIRTFNFHSCKISSWVISKFTIWRCSNISKWIIAQNPTFMKFEQLPRKSVRFFNCFAPSLVVLPCGNSWSEHLYKIFAIVHFPIQSAWLSGSILWS